MMKSAKTLDFPDILSIHNIISPLPQFPWDPPYRRQCQSGGQRAARSCGTVLRGFQIHIPECQEQGGAWGGLELPAAHGVVGICARVVLGAQGATVGCQQRVAAAVSCRDTGEGAQTGCSLPLSPLLVRPPEQPLGTCSLFTCFPRPKHHFLMAFLDAPSIGNCPQGDPGMKLP